jgi:sugar/nucleoside kinase (ribokinase family)
MTAAGADIWGDWLRSGIMAEGISGEFFQLVPGGLTPVSVVTVDSDGEATIAMYGDDMRRLFVDLDSVLPKALADVDALFFTSNTLTGPVERELTFSALQHATSRHALVIFDANLRLARWSDSADAVASCMSVLDRVSVLKCNLEDARILSGGSTAEAAAHALTDKGPEFVIVTLGAEGAYMRGAMGQAAHFPANPALPRCTLGAGDAVSASLIAHLGDGRAGWEAISAGVREGMVLGSRAIEEWGAFAPQAGG